MLTASILSLLYSNKFLNVVLRRFSPPITSELSRPYAFFSMPIRPYTAGIMPFSALNTNLSIMSLIVMSPSDAALALCGS